MRKDLPCAACGEMMWRGPDSLPVGQATCRPCRQSSPSYRKPSAPKTFEPKACLVCSQSYVPARIDSRYCSTECHRRRPRGLTKAKANCEVCAEPFTATYRHQRTCGRICGAVIKRPRPVAVSTLSVVKWRACSTCSTPYTTKGCRRCPCVVTVRRPPDWRGETACQVCGALVELHRHNMKRRHCDACLVDYRRRAKARRRAMKRDAYRADVSPAKVFERDNYRCKLCGKRLNMKVVVPHPMAPTIDHIVPLAQGGLHEPANAQAAHFLCNSTKGDRGGNEQLLLIG